ncbi:MAG: protein phosphatase 2C domain-containing protein [Desulfobacterota bacterium]|nr:protein phosphatase 2C domain-containing protein [Thermodesulfobacteriota bacterium]
MIQVEAAGLSDVGRIRENNEDAYLIDEVNRLYLVADGMGGHQAGEVASNLVITTFQRLLQHPLSETEAQDNLLSPEANRLAALIHAANKAVYEKSLERDEYRGMGSTLAAVYYTDATFIVANVGDSPVYLVRGRSIEPLSVTHTVAAEFGATHPERLHQLPEKVQHMLTRAIGIGPEIVPDICELQGFKGDIIVLCSDGLSNKVSLEEIAEIAGAEPPAAACRRLVTLANQRGGEDNITVIILKIKDTQQRCSLLQRLGTYAKKVLRSIQ